MIFINETKLFIECNNPTAVYARKLIKFSSSPNQFEIPRRLKIQISTALSTIQTIYTATGIETEKLNESHAYFHSFSYPFRTDKESSSNTDEREEKNFKRGRVLKIFEMGNTAACCFAHGVASKYKRKGGKSRIGMIFFTTSKLATRWIWLSSLREYFSSQERDNFLFFLPFSNLTAISSHRFFLFTFLASPNLRNFSLPPRKSGESS